jgi:hypothetical protein
MYSFYSHNKIIKKNHLEHTIVFSMIFTISILFFGFSQNAYAVEVSDEPQEYVVGISLRSVGEINKQIGSYDLDFWYSIYSEGKDLLNDPPPEVDFINGKSLEFSSQYLGSNIYEQRVQGTFVGPMDFHDFPFEKIHLRVELEPVTPFNTDYVVLSVDPSSGIDNTANIPGWFISEPTFTVSEQQYGNDENNYDRYVADFTVERSPIGSFLKIIFPILIVVAIGFIAYMFPSNFDLQAALALLPLGAIVFLQVSTLDELPPLGYLTIYDKMMVIVYALIANNVIAIGRQVKLEHSENEKPSYDVSKFHIKISPVIAIVLGVILFLGVE